MKIRYMGPQGSVNIAGFGTLKRNETGDFVESKAEELMASKRQIFVLADPEPYLIQESQKKVRKERANEQ